MVIMVMAGKRGGGGSLHFLCRLTWKTALWFLYFMMLTFSFCIIFPISSLQTFRPRCKTISRISNTQLPPYTAPGLQGAPDLQGDKLLPPQKKRTLYPTSRSLSKMLHRRDHGAAFKRVRSALALKRWWRNLKPNQRQTRTLVTEYWAYPPLHTHTK